MTEVKEQIQVLQDRTIKTICDKCGKDVPDYGDYYLYDRISVSYEYSTWGDSWTEYGWSIEDLCLDCCKDLEKLLRDNGYKLKDANTTWR